MWIGIGLILGLICIILSLYVRAMKKQLREWSQELLLTQEASYNRQLTMALFDKDLTELGIQINHNLDYQKRMKLEAEKSEKNIRQNVADIAHDLRTPLTVIKGNLQMLKAEESLSEKGAKYLEICTEKAEEMHRMADDFFALSLLESDMEAVELKRVDLTELLLQFLIRQEAVIRNAGMEPQVHFPSKSIFVLVDEQLMMRVLGNLLNNVLRHGKGDSFQIRLEESKEECIISFVNELDTTQELDTEALFDRTYRGNRMRSGSGAGLGLYIVKLLVQRQKGRVFAQIEENTLSISMGFGIYR